MLVTCIGYESQWNPVLILSSLLIIILDGPLFLFTLVFTTKHFFFKILVHIHFLTIAHSKRYKQLWKFRSTGCDHWWLTNKMLHSGSKRLQNFWKRHEWKCFVEAYIFCWTLPTCSAKGWPSVFTFISSYSMDQSILSVPLQSIFSGLLLHISLMEVSF